MKITEYFDRQKEIGLSNGDKLKIYQKIISKRNEKKVFKRTGYFYVKNSVYSLIIIGLLFGLYGTYFFNGNIVINKDGFFIQKISGINQVNADYIAKIIDFNGVFYIEHNDKYYQSSYIQDGDIITLKENAEMIFNIQQGSEAKIIGPAKFILSKLDSDKDNFRLNLIYGSYVEVKANNSDNLHTLEFKTQDITVKQGDLNNGLSFEFINKDGQSLIKNKGSQILITKLDDQNKEIKKELNKEEVLSIQKNDIAILTVDDFNKALNKQDISQTLSFNDIQKISEKKSIETKGNIETTIDENIDIEIDQTTTSKDLEAEYNPVISKKIGINPNSKDIPNENQINKLNGILYKSFVMNDIQNIYISYLHGNQSNTTNLENKIKQIYNLFDLKYNESDNNDIGSKIKNITSNINNLTTKLQESYYIPNKYINNLNKINNRLDYINNLDYGSNEDFESNIENRKQLINNLPEKLIFN